MNAQVTRTKGSISIATGALALWLPVYWFIGQYDGALPFVNTASLVMIAFLCIFAAVGRIATSPLCLWFPIDWFLLTSAVYYGIGPLLFYWGNPETVVYSNAYYQISDGQIFRATILNLAGIIVTLSTYQLARMTWNAPELFGAAIVRTRGEGEGAIRTVAIVFLSIGVPVKLLLVLPRTLGLTDLVLPGSVEHFAILPTLSLVPLFLLYRLSKTVYAVPFFGVLVFEVGTAYLSLSKLAILKVALTLLLGAVLQGVRIRRLLVVGIVGMASYGLVLAPLVTLSRIAYGAKGLTNLTDAKSALEEFFMTDENELAVLFPSVQLWWSRLNYANAQAFAMDAYDQGAPGETFYLSMYTLVPRLIFPDKPIMTSGIEFNTLVTGNSESHSSPGMFAEAYWNGGWMVAVATFIFLGPFYWLWEAYGRRQLSRLRLEYIPVMWVGLFSAIQQDSWFSATTIGAVPTAVLFHLLPLFLMRRSAYQINRPTNSATR